MFANNFAKVLWKKNNTLNIRCLVDESFVPANQRTNVLYCRLSDFCMYVQLKSAASCLFAVRDINGSFRFRGSYSHRPPARARGGYFAAAKPLASPRGGPPPLTTVSWLCRGAASARVLDADNAAARARILGWKQLPAAKDITVSHVHEQNTVENRKYSKVFKVYPNSKFF